MNGELRTLLDRQKAISDQMNNLAKEAGNIAREIQNIIESNNSKNDWLKVLIVDNLQKRGFKVDSGSVKRTRVTIAEKGEMNVAINIRVAKFRSGNCNAWYTLNNDALDGIDYYALGYLDKNGDRNFAVVPKGKMLEICNQLKPTADGRSHLSLNGDSHSLKEINSKVNLSRYIGALSIIR